MPFGSRYIVFLVILDLFLFIGLIAMDKDPGVDVGRTFQYFGNVTTDEFGNPQFAGKNSSQSVYVNPETGSSAVVTDVVNFFTQGIGMILELFRILWAVVTVSYTFVTAFGMPWPANIIIALVLNIPGVLTLAQFIFGRQLS